MNCLFIRHAERDHDAFSLNSIGRERALFYSEALPAIAQQYFQTNIQRIFYRSYNHYTLRCQQTVLPLAFQKQLPLIAFDNNDDEVLKKTDNGLSLVCTHHHHILSLVQHYCNYRDKNIPFYWAEDNYCTAILIRRGVYLGNIPIYLSNQEKLERPIFENFESQCFLSFIPSNCINLPDLVVHFLRMCCLYHKELMNIMTVYGGWIRQFLLKNVSHYHNDIDIHCPLEDDDLQNLLQKLQSSFEYEFYRSISNVGPVYHVLFPHDHIKMDISNIHGPPDFTCNSGFVRIPSLACIEYRYPEAKSDILHYRLRAVNTAHLSFFRVWKMMALGFRFDPHDPVFNEIQKMLAHDRPSDVSIAQYKELCAFAHVQPVHISRKWKAVLLLGGLDTPIAPYHSWINTIDESLDAYGTIVFGSPTGVVWEIVQGLLQLCQTRQVHWINYHDTEKQYETHINLFLTSSPNNKYSCYSDISLRTHALLTRQYDKILVFPGKLGTLLEKTTLQIQHIHFDEIPDSP